LHVAVFGAIFAWTLISHSGKSWGEHDVTAGAIQATMVSALPLPPKQRTLDNGVLTSEAPSPAPVQEKEKTEAAASPKDIAIPTKPTKPVKTADKTVEPPKHVQPVPVNPTKAVTGETGGIRIAQSTTPISNGSASVYLEDHNFGDRYAYYGRIINQKVARNWYTAEANPALSGGKRVTVIFEINRDGIPTNIHFGTRSGVPALDTSALRAVQRVQDEGFGPLPAGDHLMVEYGFICPTQ
jgi:protein TonB